MAASNNQIHRLSQQRLSNGHSVYCLISVQSLADRETWPYAVNFTNDDCRDYPTSWTLEIVYQQIQERGVFSCFATLKRNDSFNIFVHANVLISFLNTNGQVVRFRQTILNELMRAGEESRGSIADGRLPTCLRFSNSQDIDVQFTILITSCHSVTKFEPITERKSKSDEKRSTDEDSDEDEV